MLYLIAYDISSPARLRRVAKTCEQYGARIEKSVFECDLAPERFDKLWARLQKLVAEDEDALVAYRICKSCAAKIESAGALRRPDQRLMYCL
ncbi:MAG: CRISPR-associated endonuclease Cas2 [Candidatus Pacebacteria bacterium]|nr:CRISPR-associated endonuclease Cas2 [Candidatus Paceibacterota bacterium]